MLQENLQINIGANTQDLQTGLNQATGAVNNFSNAVQKSTKPTGDATQSLVNLSRIAQDAPYGFMGIANNLNPMLESFQQLSKKSDGAGNALKAMVAGLTGPAGIGLALGVVSSLVVTFGKDIGDFFSKLSSGSASLAETNKMFGESKDAFTKAYVEMQNLSNSFDNFHNGTKSKKSVLDEYNSTLGKVYGTTKDIGEAEKLYIANSEAYVKAAMYRAASQLAMQKAAEQAFKQQELANNPKSAGGMDIGGAIGSSLLSKFVGADVMSASQAGAFQAATDKAKGLEKTYLDIADSFNAMVSKTNSAAEKSKLFGKEETKGKDTALQDRIAQIEQQIKANNDWANSEMKLHETLQKFERKGGADIAKASTGVSMFSNALYEQDLKRKDKEDKPDLLNKKLDKDVPKWAQDDDASIKKVDKDLKQAQKTATDFANTMSKEVTSGLMTMWDAMASGENPLQALGNFFKDLLKQLAAAVVQAVLFQVIMSSLGMGGVGGGGGAGGIIGGIGKIFGFAEGGIVSQPTLSMVGEGGQSEAIMPLNKLGNMMNSTFNAGAMSGQGGGGNGQFTLKGNDLVLAMQRSNFSLNVRR
jgi:hypothetical protein